MAYQLTLFEFEGVFDSSKYLSDSFPNNSGIYPIPSNFFEWLKKQCLGLEVGDGIHWLKLRNKQGKEVIQFAGYVGVLRSPSGDEIEILPKTGSVAENRVESIIKNRNLLLNMLRSLPDFRHFKSTEAELKTLKFTLLEIFIKQFLMSVETILQRGIRRDYLTLKENVYALKGKLLIAEHIKQNAIRPDRFFTEHDEYSPNRAENRLIATALRKVLSYSSTPSNLKLARELAFIFFDIPDTKDVVQDFQRVRIDRGMNYYESALDWARLILSGQSPLTGLGKTSSISLLFPMSAVFESYVAKNLSRNLKHGWQLKTQSTKNYLVTHVNKNWFQLKPDMLISHNRDARYVLDTKWKLLDTANSADKFGLSQSDFYQLYVYGQYYLKGEGSLILIYPMTERFTKPLEEFIFKDGKSNLKLYVVPYDLENNNIVATNIFDEPLLK